MKRLAATAIIMLATSAAHAQQTRTVIDGQTTTTYNYDRRGHETTVTTVPNEPSQETVYYNGMSEADKVKARIEFCRKFVCAKEIPLQNR